MTKHALTMVALALAWTTPAFAQDAAEEDAEVGTDDEASVDASPASPYDEPPPTTPDERASSSPRDEPAVSSAPSPSRSSAPAPSATASQQPVQVVVHRRHDDDEEEPAPGGDPYDILYIELFGGASYVDLRAIQVTNYYPEFVRLSGWGPAGGLAAGFRWEFLSVGLRGALAHYDVSDSMHPSAVFDVGTAAAEVTLSLPIEVVKPYIRAGFGLAWHGVSNLDEAWMNRMLPSDVETTVFGWVFQGGIGLDIYIAEWFAIGGAFSIDVLNMSRHTWDGSVDDPTGVSFRQSGDAVGVQARGQAAISFHF